MVDWIGAELAKSVANWEIDSCFFSGEALRNDVVFACQKEYELRDSFSFSRVLCFSFAFISSLPHKFSPPSKKIFSLLIERTSEELLSLVRGIHLIEGFPFFFMAQYCQREINATPDFHLISYCYQRVGGISLSEHVGLVLLACVSRACF